MIKNILKSITRQEWIFLLIACAAAVLLAIAPYAYGYFTRPAGQFFLGLHAQTPGDFPVYYSYINQAREGRIFFRDLFTGEPQTLGTFNFFWLILGWICRLTGLGPVLVFHLARLALVPIFILILYFFTANFISERRWRYTALILIFGSGFGGFYSLFFREPSYGLGGATYLWPIDLWVTHAFPFLTLFQSPHFILSWILMILILGLSYLGITGDKLRYSAAAGLTALGLFNFHPYNFPLIFLIIFSFAVLNYLKDRKNILVKALQPAAVVILSGPSLAYHWWLIANSPVIAQRAGQNITRLPPFFFTALGYGIIFFLALAAVYYIFRKKSFEAPNLFLLSWFFAVLVLLPININFQSRFLQGFIIPMALLSAPVVAMMVKRINTQAQFKKIKFALAAVMIFIIYFSNLLNFAKDFVYYDHHQEFFNFPQEMIDGIGWLGQNADIGQVILGSPQSGLFIAGLAARQVYLGHGQETIDFDQKKQRAENFFRSASDESRIELLKNNHIKFIFYGRFEANDYGDNNLSKDYLEIAYRNPQVVIYRVKI